MSTSRGLELWGGHECTINRVRDSHLDQTRLSGHDGRLDDLDRFAELGLRAIRYPALWERIEPEPGRFDWRATDTALERLRGVGVRPILGLVHHGSGPLHTDLLSQEFASGVAAHARRVAERYPWVQDWTPINEPLTTARFSALYGHWYPHRRDERSFWTALFNQIDAVRLSMAAIRSVIPSARLIQTEDVGRTYSTPRLHGQAKFDNQRRWAAFDLLCGTIVPRHPLWRRLERFGFADRLRAAADSPCSPDLIGINHYLTSDRFLDHRTNRYPPHTIGRNHYGAFADVEAVRVLAPARSGLEVAILDVWERYGLPIALTEIHNGCTREEQMRWFFDGWQIAQSLRDEGVDLRAVTAWSLLGAFDWDSLLTRRAGSYECGVFDVRDGTPRPTAMAGLLRELAAGQSPTHPVLTEPGWWRRPDRLLYPAVRVATTRPARQTTMSATTRPIVITGATGTLGQALARECAGRAIPYLLTGRERLSLTRPFTIDRLLDEVEPWAVINAAGWVRVDDAETDPDGCVAVNRDGALRLARACAERSIHFTTFSSDLVFDGAAGLGTTGRPYRESDPMRPLNVYGRSKSEADAALLSWTAPILVLRTAAFFSPHDPHNFATQLVAALRRGDRFAAANCLVSPTFVPDLVRATLDLVVDGESGLWHLVNQGGTSWAEFGREIARATGLSQALVTETEPAEMGWRAERPLSAAMCTSRGQLLPSLDHAIGRFATAMAA